MTGLLLVLVLAAAPSAEPWSSCGERCHRLTLAQGTARVEVFHCARLDLPALRSAVLHAYAHGAAQRPEVARLPLDVTVRLTTVGLDPYDGLHSYDAATGRSQILLRCSRERVLEHELFHRFAHQLELPCDRALVHHRHGWDLRCEPR